MPTKFINLSYTISICWHHRNWLSVSTPKYLQESTLINGLCKFFCIRQFFTVETGFKLTFGFSHHGMKAVTSYNVIMVHKYWLHCAYVCAHVVTCWLTHLQLDVDLPLQQMTEMAWKHLYKYLQNWVLLS